MSTNQKITIGIICTIFITSRLSRLMVLPPFIDELLYLRWTNSISTSTTNVFISAHEDGQPPLFFIVAGSIKYLVPNLDTLVLLRLLAIGGGGLTLYFGIKLVKKISNNQNAWKSFAILYLSSPFMLMYDHLGMRESWVSAALLGSLYGIVSKQFLLAGICLAIGIATKSTAWFIIVAIACLLISLRCHITRTQLLQLLLPTIVIMLLFLTTGSFNVVISKNGIFVGTNGGLVSQLRNNIYSTGTWLIQYVGIPVLLGLGFTLTQLTQSKQKPLLGGLLLAVLVLIGGEIIVAKIYFPRYIIQAVLLLFIFISVSIRRRWVIGVMCILPMIWSIQLIKDPYTAPLPQIERWQYLSGWPAGTGVKEIAQCIANLQPDKIITEDTDLLRTGIPYYQPHLAPLINPQFNQLPPISPAGKTIVALHLKKELPAAYNGTIKCEYQKPDQGDWLVAYELK